MTGNIKTPYKQRNESTDTKKPDQRNKSRILIMVWYIPITITMFVCLVLSLLSVRLSYLTSDSVHELREEVFKLKSILGDTLIGRISHFEQVLYNEYADADDSNANNPLQQEKDDVHKETIESSNQADVIGVVRFVEAQHTTPDPESVLAKMVIKDAPKRRVVRSVEPSAEIIHHTNFTGESKIVLVDNYIQELKSLSTATPDVPHALKQRIVIKRSSADKHGKYSVTSNRLRNTLHISDSVEEFSVGPEPTTPKIDIPSKRSKGRSRHTIETMDDRATSGKRKIIPAIHLDGDSSGYVVGKHTNYNGNGHLSHPSQVYSDWIEADWVKNMGMNEYFTLEKGLVKIKESGVYLLYVQIYYLDDHDTNGYRAYKNEEALLQCTTMTHSTEKLFKGNTCFTSRIEYLKEDDVISIRDLGNSRYTIFESGKSFFGLVKLK